MPEIKKPPASEMCPPGHHVVRGHERVCHSGTTTWVDAHIRRNRGSIPTILLSENIYFLFWSAKKKYGKIGKIYGFPETSELDSAVQFWLDYWKEQGIEFPSDLDPLLIKTLIAIESGFDPKARSKVKGSSATGLMQVTDQTRRILSGRPNKNGYREVKSEYLEIKKEEATDSLVSIATGTRWLAHKYLIIPKAGKRNVHNMIKNYHSWNEDGEVYAKKVEDLYEKSK